MKKIKIDNGIEEKSSHAFKLFLCLVGSHFKDKFLND